MPAHIENFIRDAIRPAVFREFPEVRKRFSYEKTPRRYLRLSFDDNSTPDIVRITYYDDNKKKIARIAVTIMSESDRSFRGGSSFVARVTKLKQIS